MEHSLFKPSSFEDGRHQVVGDCAGFTMSQRWDAETPVFAQEIINNAYIVNDNRREELFKEHTSLSNYHLQGSQILDYGCGIGRISKEILKQNEQVRVVGLDASQQMLDEAKKYVDNNRFKTVLPNELVGFDNFDLIYAVYVLQHCPAIELREVLWRIYTYLKDDGVFVYCSSDYRMAVRYDTGGFFDDRFLGVNLQEEISRFFIYEKELFTDEILEKNPIVKTMVKGSLPHPAKVYRKKPNVNFLNASIETIKKEPKIEIQTKSINEAKKLLLVNRLAPGDILVMTNAIRDLHLSYPNTYQTDVNTPCDAIFENNPYITRLDYNRDEFNKINGQFSALSTNDMSIDKRTAWLDDILVIDMQYPLIHYSGERGSHFSEGHREWLEHILNIKITQTTLCPSLYLSQTERDWVSPVIKKEFFKPYWVLNAGTKGDYTLKQYPYYQEVVDLLKDQVTFVQIGEKSHNHVPLNGTVNMVGQTTIRELIRLIYYAEGVITCVSLPMHIAGALRKPCVVVAGGREGTRWELYSNHRFIYLNGCLPCSPYDGCWKSKMEDCKNKVNSIPRCMTMIKPLRIAEEVLLYYDGGMLRLKTED